MDLGKEGQTVDSVCCADTPQNEAEGICDDWEQVDPQSVLSLRDAVVAASESDGDPVAHETTDNATVEYRG